MNAARIDLHCHTTASFDGAVTPERAVLLAHERGLTHLAITDHDTLAGALRARDEAAVGLTIIVGQEARTREGDLIGLFLEQAIPSGMSVEDTAAAIRVQGGLVGLPHPFDFDRPSIGRGAGRADTLARLAGLVDYVETYNGRVEDERANARAAEFANAHGLPGVAVSDAHTEREIGMAWTTLDGPVDGPLALLAALRTGATLQVRRPAAESAGSLAGLRRRLRRYW